MKLKTIEYKDLFKIYIKEEEVFYNNWCGSLEERYPLQDTEEDFSEGIRLDERDADVYDFQVVKEHFRKHGRVVKDVPISVYKHFRKKYLTEDQYFKKVS